MRQSDILDSISEIIVGSQVEAAPENYEICHRYVTRSDAQVCAAFERALAESSPIGAEAFQRIRETAGPPRGQIDVGKHMTNLDEQIAAVLGAASEAANDAASYSTSLTDGARSLGLLNVEPDAAVIIGNLISHTRSMSERVASLEAKLAGASSELSIVRDDLKRAKLESGTDALTSLPNRRTFDSRLAQAIEDALKARQPLSLAFCDVDHFKKFNDTWGHKLGDEVLRFVASQMVKHFGTSGLPARFGGEEFVVLLPQHTAQDATKTVNLFCQALGSRMLKLKTDGQEVGKITLSAGVATLQFEESPQALIGRADEAMYAAKKAGRNQVVCATSLSAMSHSSSLS